MTPMYSYNNDRVWSKWNKYHYYDLNTTNVASSTTSTAVWKHWINAGVTTSYTLNTSTANTLMYDPWPAWQYTVRVSDRFVVQTLAEASRLLANDTEWQARQEAEETRRREAAAQRDAAKARAMRLLREHLDDEQRRQLDEDGEFHITSSRGRRFCLQMGRAHNVFEVDAAGNRLTEFCGHVGDAVPDEDNVLAQKLLIECDEDAFVAIANSWRLTNGRRPGMRTPVAA